MTALATVESLALSVASLVSETKAPNTKRAYSSAWSTFTAWCDSHGAVAMPAEQTTVAAYLAHLVDVGRAVSTLEQALAAIGNAHRAAGEGWFAGELVRQVMSGARRRLGTAPKRAKAALSVPDLRAVLAATDADTLIGARDRALLLLGFAGAFRRSELTALAVTDVCFVADGAIVTIRRGKTDQLGHGTEKAIPFGRNPGTCPVLALRHWLRTSALTDGPLFREVRGELVAGHALQGRAVARVLQRLADAAGLDVETIGGHSLRAGGATAVSGRGLEATMRVTGHKSERIAKGYVRRAGLFVDHPMVGVL